MKRYCKNCKNWDDYFGTKNEAFCFILEDFTHAFYSCNEHRFEGEPINLTPYV